MATRTSKRSTGLWKRRGRKSARPFRETSNLRDAMFRLIRRSRVFSVSAARRRRIWLAAAAVTAAALMAATACDQGFSVAPSADGGESRPTPAVAFKTPRTEPTTEAEPTPTAESAETPISETDESPPTETPEPTSAPATATPTTETTATETPTPETYRDSGSDG